MMNPFTLNYDSKYFCDREDELSHLEENINNGRNTLLHSPRRLGKSALIRHLFHSIEKQKTHETIFVDLFATGNMNEMIEVLARKILEKYYSRNFLKGAQKLLKGLSPNISISPDGSMSLGLNIRETHHEATLSELFNYLENRKKEVIIAFDEFQLVAFYPEKAEAQLRTHIQGLKNIRFIFSGSSSHLLQQMFFSARRPFYQSVEVMTLGKIDHDNYSAFIKKLFVSFRKEIDDEATEHLLRFSDGYTYYTQSICNQAFSKTGKRLSLENAINITSDYIENRKEDYQSLLMLLPENQRKVAIAVAREEFVQKPTSMDFIQKYNLPPVSSVLQAIKSLTSKEIVYLTNDGFVIYDVFFKRFLQKYY